MITLASAALLVAVTLQAASVQRSTYDAVVAGMKCQQNSLDGMECDYRVGRSLHFNIAGVGDEDASITFFAASFEGDYYGSIGVLHGCVIVKPGKASESLIDFAFVSPRTGKVYADWQSCRQAK
jgi:hypothetical protein